MNAASRPGGPAVVLGVGNLLMGDDGFGVHAVVALRHDGGLPGDVRIIDGGTGGLALLPLLDGVRALLILDAVDVGAPPGSIHTVTGDRLFAGGGHLSVHQAGTADLIATARLTGTLPGDTVLIGVQPASTASGVELSPTVAAALPDALARVRDWCRATRTIAGSGE